MSEPGYGTDVLGMKTTATRDGDSCALIRLLEKILHTSLCAATAYPLLLPWVLCASLRTPTRDVRRDCSYVINGAKMWITNGAVTDTEQARPLPHLV